MRELFVVTSPGTSFSHQFSIMVSFILFIFVQHRSWSPFDAKMLDLGTHSKSSGRHNGAQNRQSGAKMVETNSTWCSKNALMEQSAPKTHPKCPEVSFSMIAFASLIFKILKRRIHEDLGTINVLVCHGASFWRSTQRFLRDGTWIAFHETLNAHNASAD